MITRVTNRGGKGVKTLNITEKTGNLVAIKGVTDKEDLMIINRSGVIIRIAISELRVMGRATQGVRLITIKRKRRNCICSEKLITIPMRRKVKLMVMLKVTGDRTFSNG